MFHEGLLPVAAQDDRLLHRAPTQPRDNGLDAAPGARAVVAGADKQAIGAALGFFQAGIIAAVEKILQGTAHIAKVFRGAENDAVSRQNVLRPRLERAARDHFDIIAVPGAGQDGLEQALGIGRGRVDDDEQTPGHAVFRASRPNSCRISVVAAALASSNGMPVASAMRG